MLNLSFARKLVIILTGLVVSADLLANLPTCPDGCTGGCPCTGQGGGGGGGNGAPGNGAGPGPFGPGPFGPGPFGPGPFGGGWGGGGWGGGLGGGGEGGGGPAPLYGPRLSGGGKATNGSINVSINFGRPANENVNVIGQFSIFSKTASAALYSPSSLQYRNYLLDKINQSQDSAGISAYTGADSATSQNASTGLPSGVSRQVKLFTADRKILTYDFSTGSGMAKVSGEQAFLNFKMKMVDAAGNETTSSPSAYAMYIGNGYNIRYSSTSGKTVSYRLPNGRTILPGAPSVGLEALYDEAGSIRQVWSLADGLADVVMTNPGVSYEIRIYSPANAGTKSGKYYVPTGTPHTVWRIENPTPGQTDTLKVTKTVNGNSDVYLYSYSHTSEDWVLNYPDGQVVSSKTSSWDYSRTIRTEITVKKTASGQVASKSTSTYQTYAFGDRLVVEIEDPDGANRRTTYTYYTDAGQPGSYSRIATVSHPDGSWENIQYDSNGRKSLVVTPWKNSPMNSPAGSAKATYYSYAPLDSRDTLTPDDERPRTTEEKILGVTVGKIYHAYYVDNGQYVEIEERCPTAASAYGDSSSLRTEKRYYVAGDCTSATAGRLYRETFPDGTIKTYTYENGNWTPNADPAQSIFTPGSGSAVRMSVVYGTAASPSGIANKTVREVTVYDERGNTVWSERQAYTGLVMRRLPGMLIFTMSFPAWSMPIAQTALRTVIPGTVAARSRKPWLTAPSTLMPMTRLSA